MDRPDADHSTAAVDETVGLLSESPASREEAHEPKKPWLRLLIICLICIYLIDLGSQMVTAPLVRIYESVYCIEYWSTTDPSKILPDGRIPEDQCKVDEVQKAVAWIFGWQGVWDSIPGILLGIPYGAMADRWGRKWIVTLSFAGIALSAFWIIVVATFDLPLLSVWFSSAFLLIGGGPVVASSMLITVVADVSPESVRTQNFFYLHASIIVGELFGPMLGSWLMRKSVWYPLIIGAVIQVVSVLVSMFIPETIQYKPAPPTVGLHEPVDGDEGDERPTPTGEKSLLTRSYIGLKDTMCFALKDRNVALIVLIALLTGLCDNNSTLLFQYVSKRYGWKIADAALLSTLTSALNLVVFVLVLPYVPKLLSKRYKLSNDGANLQISRASAFLVSLGFFVVGLSPILATAILGLVAYVFGSGYASTLRSVATTLVGGEGSHDLARLYTTISIATAAGGLINGPITPLVFGWGLRLGGAWLGLPYLASGVFMIAVGTATCLIRLPKDAEPRQP